MMNKAASERRAEKNFLDDFAAKKERRRRMLLYSGCCAAQISAKLQNQSLLARRTWLLLGKLDFVIN
jgi:hypothetical protein